MSKQTETKKPFNFQEHVDAEITKLLQKHGAFFAFSNQQFNEQKTEGTKYVDMGAGLICPKDKADTFNREFNEFIAKVAKLRVEHEGIENIIKYELYNHEAFYTGDIEPVMVALRGYDVTYTQVLKVYNAERENVEAK